MIKFSTNPYFIFQRFQYFLEKAGSLTTDQYKKMKAIESRPGILYGLCKVHKAIIDNCVI